ncbi:MAG: hypothetical protein HZC44_01340 [Geobacter sp.]|nr:hypothetical protein [Geobacter sp.]
MTGSGFHITRLTLSGIGVPKAEVCFKTGLNVVSGPSDTGKTFIVQCIDFMFGASTSPKSIPEAEPYDLLQIGLRTPDEADEIILERGIRGGDVNLYRKSGERLTLGIKHRDGDESTVSNFLLTLSGLVGKKIRTNSRGTTRSLSFRDVARLILVNEETIIRELSPIYSLRGGYSTRPVESSVLRLLLSGVDDASVVAKEDIKITRGKQQGKAEVIEVLLDRARQRSVELNLDGSVTEWRQNLARVDALFSLASAELAVEQKTVSIIEERRRSAWTHLRQLESRKDVLTELQKRFELLQQQYVSDLRRLETIAEAGVRLGQMKEERCPVCGSLAEYHVHTHQRPEAAPDDVASASLAEANKIKILLTDLQSTRESNDAEIVRLVADCERKQTELNTIATELADQIKPRVNAALQKLRDSQVERDLYKRALEIQSRVDELTILLREITNMKPEKPSGGTSTKVGADEAEAFCQQIEYLLKDWQFPGLGRVTFGEEDQDIVISGRDRTSHGKGVRAIAHAAFNLALMRLCLIESLPHPGLVVIDSPLVVYREPDTDEGEFSRDVKDAFYRSVAKEFPLAQVIIFENEDPPIDIGESTNVIRFTGANHGRRGFIPLIEEYVDKD